MKIKNHIFVLFLHRQETRIIHFEIKQFFIIVSSRLSEINFQDQKNVRGGNGCWADRGDDYGKTLNYDENENNF